MENLLQEFICVLRTSGVRISPAEHVDALRALDLVGYRHRDTLKHALSAALAKSLDEKMTFARTFELFFRLEHFAGQSEQEPGAVQHIAAPAHVDDSPLTRMLLAGDASGLAMSLQDAAHAEQTHTIRFATQKGIYTRRILQSMGLEALQRDISRVERVGSSASELKARELKRARSELLNTVKRFVERQYDLFGDPRAQSAREQYLVNARLSDLDQRDLARLSTIIQKMVQRLNALYSRRKKPDRRGRLDFKKTLRKNVAFQGLLFDRKWVAKKVERPDVIAFCDVSRSVSTVVRFLLLFLYGLNQTMARIRTFVFCSNIVEVSRLFDAHPVAEALARIENGAGLEIQLGRTDYGRAFSDFKENWFDAVTGKTTVIVLGDARNNDGDPQTAILRSLQQRCKTLIWLNPERRSAWGTGDSEMKRYLPYCHVAAECYSVKHLEKLVHTLLHLPLR